MCRGKWRDNPRQLVYQRPYEDHWGVLHDPTTEWDRLLKYYQIGVILLVEEGTRRIARPASIHAQAIIRRQKQRHLENLNKTQTLEIRDLKRLSDIRYWKRRNLNKTQTLEIRDLKRLSDIRYWKRRKKRKIAARRKEASYARVTLGRDPYGRATSSA
jgi:hypothetical protein